ncbi:MAG: hypothetical protein IT531_09935 [Burkholderiales bacterium]|nr:hypothetical protein [Burkholderiales bacterium]
MKRIVVIAAAMAACACVLADVGCIDEGYDPMPNARYELHGDGMPGAVVPLDPDQARNGVARDVGAAHWLR